MLRKRISPNFHIVTAFDYCDGSLATGIIRSAVGGGRWNVERTAFKGCAVEMKQRRNGEDSGGVDGVHPGEIAEYILLALTVADSRRLRIRVIGHLVIIGACRSGKAQLVTGSHVENQ